MLVWAAYCAPVGGIHDMYIVQRTAYVGKASSERRAPSAGGPTLRLITATVLWEQALLLGEINKGVARRCLSKLWTVMKLPLPDSAPLILVPPRHAAHCTLQPTQPSLPEYIIMIIVLRWKQFRLYCPYVVNNHIAVMRLCDVISFCLNFCETWSCRRQLYLIKYIKHEIVCMHLRYCEHCMS